MTARLPEHPRAAKIFVQPRPPRVVETIAWAAENDFGVEVIETAEPPALAGGRSQLMERYREMLRHFPGPVIVHGAYYDVYVHSPDPGVRRASEERVDEDIAFAQALGARSVIFHTNHLPCTTKAAYTDLWIRENNRFWASRVESAGGVEILLENMWDAGPDLIGAVLDAVPALSACFDVGHAHVFSPVPASEWIATLAPRLTYLHVSDNGGDADSGLPPGEGTIDWRAFSDAVREHAPGAATMIGMGEAPVEAVQTTLHYLAERGLHPFAGASAAISG